MENAVLYIIPPVHKTVRICTAKQDFYNRSQKQMFQKYFRILTIQVVNAPNNQHFELGPKQIKNQSKSFKLKIINSL